MITTKRKQVKCQGCGSLHPVIKNDASSSRLTRSNNSGRIYQPEKRIRLAEKYHVRDSCKKEKEELKELLEEERKRDILRRLPLYSNRMTGYRWLCSKCYDEAYYSFFSRKNNKA